MPWHKVFSDVIPLAIRLQAIVS